MRVLVLSNNRLQEKEIDGSLEALQEIVGGYIEIPLLSKEFNENEIDIIINEEGKYIQGLKPEIAVVDGKTKKILDVVFGNCIFASHDEYGNTTALNDKQVKLVTQELQMEATLTYKDVGKEFNAKVLFV